MKQILKRGLALLVAMVLCIGLLPQGPVHVHAVSQTAGITNTVAVGDKIVIATRDGSGAMGAQNGKYRSQVAATVADRVLTVTEEIVVLTVEAGTKSGSFALKAADGYLCYDATAGGNTMHTKAEKDESASWNITFEDESAVITNVAQADRQMQYNAGSPRFACYKGTQEKVAVYRVGKAPVAQVVCNHSITDFVCSKCGRVIAPDADSTLTLKQADKLGVALGGDSTIHAYYVSGTVKSIEDIYRGNITIEDAKGDTLYIYGSSNGTDQQYTLAVGDTVKIHGKIGSYKGAAQMINGKIVEYTKGSAAECQHKNVTDYVCECGKVMPPKADTTLTLTQAAKLGLAHGHNTYTEGKYYVEGEIKSIASEKYGNMTIVDAKGNELYIYGTYSADGVTRYDKLEVQPAVGDTVKLYGKIGSYNGTAQMQSGWIVEHNCAHAETTVVGAKPASCAAPGYTGDTVCTSCGATVQKGEEISQEEHTYVSVVTPPTYAATGFTTHTCSGCGHKYITDHQEALTPDVDLDVNVETPDVGELKEMLKQVTKDTADAFIATAKKVIDETPELREAVQPLIEAAKAIKNEVRDMIPDDLSSYDPRDLVGSLADLFF